MVWDVVARVWTLDAWVGRLGSGWPSSWAPSAPPACASSGSVSLDRDPFDYHLRRGQLVEQQTLLHRKLPPAPISVTRRHIRKLGGSVSLCGVNLIAGESLDASQARLSKVRCAEVRPGEVGPREMGSGEVGPGEIGAA